MYIYLNCLIYSLSNLSTSLSQPLYLVFLYFLNTLVHLHHLFFFQFSLSSLLYLPIPPVYPPLCLSFSLHHSLK